MQLGGVMRGKVAKVLSGALHGYDGALIEVETDIKAGLPSLQIVGMGNKAIDEARQRVRSAITNSLLEFPARKVVVNLAPAELPKDGTHLDLPIALSILVAAGQLKQTEVDNSLFVGELALNGTLRPVRGAIVMAELARQRSIRRIFLPIQNVAQARLVESIEVIGIPSLQELYRVLKGVISPTRTTPEPPTTIASTPDVPLLDDIVGHEHAKRALAIAVAGRHNILFTGSPGTGKTLLASSVLGLLPCLAPTEVVSVTKLHSLAGKTNDSVVTAPPFRSPHHSATLSALIGGGLRLRPGEISLAHKGVLFLDELPEYPRASLESLRQPLEDRHISLSRLYEHVTYPADFLLVATMNPCPCGYYGDAATACTCLRTQIQAYKKKISGPLLDRIDLRLTITKQPYEQFFVAKSLKNSQHSKVLELINTARNMQKARYNRSDVYNAYASRNDIIQLFSITPEAKKLVHKASKQLALSSRGYARVLRVARTIADLEASARVEVQHVAEALQFR